MPSGWSRFGFPLCWVSIVVSIFHPKIQVCFSLNLEGLALLEFRGRLDTDPYGALSNWDPNDNSPCMWFGVLCQNNEVHMLDLSGLTLGGNLAPELGNLRKMRALDLSGLTLGGNLAPELGNLRKMRALILYRNNLSGVIPLEFRELTKLEYLDLSHNKLTGHIPAEIGNMPSLKHLLLCNNSFEGGLPPELTNLCMPSESELYQTLPSDCSDNSDWVTSKLKMRLVEHFLDGNEDIPLRLLEKSEPCGVQQLGRVFITRRKLLESAANLPAAPSRGGKPSVGGPFSLSSGFVPATGHGKNDVPAASSPPSSSPPSTVPTNKSDVAPTSNTSNPGNVERHQMPAKWVYAVALAVVALIIIVSLVLLLMCRNRSVATIGPWKTGLSGQLQKAFVTGAPKLNRAELETACEDFSNIIGTFPDCIIYKGTLSSGVEIAVTSSIAASSEDWSKCSELYFRKKIDILSRLNHKNFVNLLGYCIEDEPFTRMMVFEYAPNGTLSEHLHVKEIEHLDWSARMRIIVGIAYCLQYMHHDMSPPVAHPNLNSSSIYLMDDFASKLVDFSYWKGSTEKMKQGNEHSVDRMNWPYADMGGNIYSFGILLLEIISGKSAYSEEHGFLVNWAVDYLNDKRSITYMIDPTLKSFKNNELDAICEIIQQCIHPDTTQRPTMKELAAKLKEVLTISPEAAAPRLSPLWWAELEILSVQAS